jgi:glycosyltransferase involved in cell wall biosynthesis
MNRDHRSIGLTSIIIPCWDQIQFTQQCFAALKEHTRPAWELIVIDNGSTDGTATYLAGARDMALVPATVVTNTTNRSRRRVDRRGARNRRSGCSDDSGAQT